MNSFQIVVGTLIGATMATAAQGQSHGTWWTFGGSNGRVWADWVEQNVLTDDVTVPGSLQALELRPDENLLPEQYEQFRIL